MSLKFPELFREKASYKSVIIRSQVTSSQMALQLTICPVWFCFGFLPPAWSFPDSTVHHNHYGHFVKWQIPGPHSQRLGFRRLRSGNYVLRSFLEIVVQPVFSGYLRPTVLAHWSAQCHAWTRPCWRDVLSGCHPASTLSLLASRLARGPHIQHWSCFECHPIKCLMKVLILNTVSPSPWEWSWGLIQPVHSWAGSPGWRWPSCINTRLVHFRLDGLRGHSTLCLLKKKLFH